MRLRDRGRKTPQKRERRPVTRTPHLENIYKYKVRLSENLAQIQPIACHLSRRHLLSRPVALVIAAEFLGGGTR